MAVMGDEKQEKKITELAEIAQRHFPDCKVMTFKGAFRQGAQKAVQKSSFNSWEEVARQPAPKRREFFNSLLQESKPHLVKFTGDNNIDKLLEQLRKENEKYLHD
ncbi:MAG: hypothetical protein ACLFRL_07105 [Desulfohalobiaceae bacterium]